MPAPPRSERRSHPATASLLPPRRPSAQAALLAAGLLLAPPALAQVTAPQSGGLSRSELAAYPAPAAGERRWLVRLPTVPPATSDPAISDHPEDWRVELIVGRTLEVDCNRAVFNGRLRLQPVAGTDRHIVRAVGVTPTATTRMACPPGTVRRQAFVPMAGRPFVMPYNASLPILLYAPADLQVRWRLWKAERRQWPARPL